MTRTPDGAILCGQEEVIVGLMKVSTFLCCVLLYAACGQMHQSNESAHLSVGSHRNPYFERGNAHIEKKEYDKAIEQYQQALQLEPDSAIIHAALGWAYYNVGMLDAAILEAEEVNRLNPNDPELRKILELLYQQRR